VREEQRPQDMTLEELVEEVTRSRKELDRLRRKSRAHRKSLKDQQRAIMERNSQIAHLDAALCTLIPVNKVADAIVGKAPVRGYLEERDCPHEDVSKDPTPPLTYKVTRGS
jgi:uncharacterized coiled-coil protein SlyX